MISIFFIKQVISKLLLCICGMYFNNVSILSWLQPRKKHKHLHSKLLMEIQIFYKYSRHSIDSRSVALKLLSSGGLI